jgi:hypothetical protein
MFNSLKNLIFQTIKKLIKFLIPKENVITITSSRIDALECLIMNEKGIQRINGKLDERLTRLEVLIYYSKNSNYNLLDSDQQDFINKLWLDFNYGIHKNTVFPPDNYFASTNPSLPSLTIEGYLEDDIIPAVLQDNNSNYYVLVNGHKLFLPNYGKEWCQGFINNTFSTIIASNSPHTYLRPQDDGVDVPQGAILADIGAAEGLFGIKYIDRCKKIYFFECDPLWLSILYKTCKPFGDKIEIVEGFVGDQPGNINLDHFFTQRKEYPNFIKMDIEGAEGCALRSMHELLSNELPLTLLICTYHRQEDWNNYYKILCERFTITSSNGYYWHIQNMYPPFLRRGVMRAVKKLYKDKL